MNYISSFVKLFLGSSGPIIVAVIAAWGALIQVRRNHITSARLKWLDNLKELISDYISELTGFPIDIHQLNSKEKSIISNEKLYESIRDNIVISNKKLNLIKLNLNPREKLHKELEDCLDELERLSGEIPAIEDFNEQKKKVIELETPVKRVIDLSRFVFKLEWERTKKGKWTGYYKIWKIKKEAEQYLKTS